MSEDDLRSLSNNDTQFPVDVDGAPYPSVTHFVLAQRFEDPTVRQQIQAAPTVQIASRIAEVNKYKSPYKIDEDWQFVMLSNYENGMYSKLEQYPHIYQQLLSTKDDTVYLPDYTGYVFEKIKRVENNTIPESTDINVAKTALQPVEKLMITKMLKLRRSLLKHRPDSLNELEIYRDIIFNISYYNYTMLDIIENYLITKSWSDIPPNILKLMRNIYRYIDNQGSVADIPIISILDIALFIGWYRNNSTSEEKKDILNFVSSKIHIDSFVDPDRTRLYRSDSTNEEEAIEESSEEAPQDEVSEDTHLERATESSESQSEEHHIPLKNSEDITIKRNYEGDKLVSFMVYGFDLPQYLAVLENLNGKYIEHEGYVLFTDTKKLKSVTNYIFSKLPDSQKYEMAYQDWLHKRLKSVIDVSIAVAELNNHKDITYDDLKFTLTELYSYDLSPEILMQISSSSLGEVGDPSHATDVGDTIDEIMDTTTFSMTLDAKNLLSKWVKYISKNIVKNLKKGKMNYHKYINRIEALTNWMIESTDHYFTSLQKQYGAYSVHELCAMRALTYISLTLRKLKPELSMNESMLEAAKILVVDKKKITKCLYKHLENKKFKNDPGTLRSIITSFVTKNGSIRAPDVITLLYVDAALSYISKHLKKSHLYKSRVRLLANLTPQSHTKLTIEDIDNKIGDELEDADDCDDGGCIVPNIDVERLEYHEAVSRAKYIGLLICSTCDKIPSGDRVVDYNFSKFPYTNVYIENTDNGFHLGSIIKKIPTDSNGQPLPSNTSQPYFYLFVTSLHPDRPHRILDTEDNRSTWIGDALAKLSETNIRSIAFYEAQIQPEYKKEFYKFTKETNIKVYLIKGFISEGASGGSAGSTAGSTEGSVKSTEGSAESIASAEGDAGLDDVSLGDDASLGDVDAGAGPDPAGDHIIIENDSAKTSGDVFDSPSGASDNDLRTIFDKHVIPVIPDVSHRDAIFKKIQRAENPMVLMNGWADLPESERKYRILTDTLSF
jgi:hypothetical protein